MSLPTLHPTAVVSPGAHIGARVRVEPYAIIDEGAVIEDDVEIGPHSVIKGSARIAAECKLHAGVVVGDDPQDLSFDVNLPTLAEIGPRSVLREYATVHRSTTADRPTRLGSDCLLMGHAHVGHDVTLGNRVILCNSALVAGHCEIGDRAFLSGNTVVHQFCRVGEGVMLSGISGVGLDVGPFLTVAERSDIVGLNAVGMRRAGFSGAARGRVKQVYRQLFRASSLKEGLAELQSLESAHEPEVQSILEFYQGTRRGYSRPPNGHPFMADSD